MATYLLINFFTVLIPLALSFENRIRYYSRWKALFPAIFVTALVFIAWDICFTRWGIWGFNPAYLLNIHVSVLPLEEVLFFICIPFACLFIYELVCYFDRDQILQSAVKPLTYGFIVFLLVTALLNPARTYTLVTFMALGVYFFIHAFMMPVRYMAHFYLMYFISVIPFLLVNGLLTNGLPAVDPGPVVWYNPAEILGLRLIGIPLEDFFYSMLLLLINVSLYETFKKYLFNPK